MDYGFRESVSDEFVKELQNLLNKHGVDSLLEIQDFVLAQLIQKFIDSLIWMKYQRTRLKGDGAQDVLY